VQRVQDTDEAREPKQDDAGRVSQASRCLIARPELPLSDRQLALGAQARSADDLQTTLWERRQVALCRGSLA
jgi:hypothetical protein